MNAKCLITLASIGTGLAVATLGALVVATVYRIIEEDDPYLYRRVHKGI